MSGIAKSMDAQDWSLLVLLSILWGGAFFFSGVAVREIPPLTLVLARVTLASAMLLPLFWWRGHRLPKTPGTWLPFLGMGVLNNVLPFSLIFAGQTHVTVGLSSVINAMTPVFTVVVMAAFGAERLTLFRATGVLLGLAGVAMLMGFDMTKSGGETLGVFLCMAGALSYGFAAFWARRMLSGVPPLKSATCQLISSTILMLAIAAIMDRPWKLPVPNGEALMAVAALALFGTAAAYIVFFTILVRAGASNAMLVTLLIPISAVLLGSIFLGERIEARELAGAVVIGMGLLFIDGRAVSWMLNRFLAYSPSPLRKSG